MKRLVVSILLGIFVFGVVISAAQAHPDGSLTERFSAEGRYDVAANGVGLFNTTSGDISLMVSGTVVNAFLYWAGFDNVSGSDDTISFSVDGGSATPLTADYVFGPDFWYATDNGTHIFEYYHYVYVENVAALVMSGSHTYSVTDIEMLYNYGAGLMVVYEDSSLPISIVKIYDGLDSGHFRFTEPRGPNTNVTCMEFDPLMYDADLDVTMFVAGVENDTRANAIWYQSGTGIKPTNLVGEGSAVMLAGPPYPYPLGAFDGYEWDTYNNNVNVPGGANWVCIQLESVNSTMHLGASLLLTSSAFVLTPPQTVGGVVFSANTINLLLPWLTSISLLVIIIFAALIRKRHQIAA